MMVMASNSDEYVVVGRLRLFPRPRLLVEKAIQTLSKDEAAGGIGSDDVEDMFVDNVDMHLKCECPVGCLEFRQVFGPCKRILSWQ
ncbi:hypothetical protein D8674_011600 [Pyrus ussuriensis x Pyrus communis]|uniref:Uncharacterized protein n=1 Tax=Pyrus ussuriensis x Pyrus communis TaxID=2448454 RepID=A0A5N5G4T3_9ROSA|nr:hypothetical protein D8674_011600 [Pyrus ussuriensis x Pyrus communis]